MLISVSKYWGHDRTHFRSANLTCVCGGGACMCVHMVIYSDSIHTEYVDLYQSFSQLFYSNKQNSERYCHKMKQYYISISLLMGWEIKIIIR
jgi:hypothetical protein